MRDLIIAILFATLLIVPAACAKGKSVAVPKRKAKKQSTWGIGQGFFGHWAREMKSQFCSELEALTLQLTRPNDSGVDSNQVRKLIESVNDSSDDIEFIMGLLAKFSRKMCENNVFTKIKSLLVVHMLIRSSSDRVRPVLAKSIDSLRNEHDSKVDLPFFSVESIEKAESTASTVSEFQAAELAREYSLYLFDFVEVRGEKKKDISADRIEALLSLVEQGLVTERSCKKTEGKLAKQCLECLRDDRQWIAKQLQKLADNGIADEALAQEVQQLLDSMDIKLKPKVSASTEQDEDAGDEADIDDVPKALKKKPTKIGAKSAAVKKSSKGTKIGKKSTK